MPTEIWVALIVFVGSVVTAYITWKMNQPSNEVNTETSYVTGANLAVDAMMDSINELRTKVKDLTTELELVRLQNKELREEIALLRIQLAAYGGELN